MATPNTRRNVSNDNPHDLYRTHPAAVNAAILGGVFDGVESAWDCCDGLGGISNTLESIAKVSVFRSDLISYTNSRLDAEIDFLSLSAIPDEVSDVDCIVMNPPFKQTAEFLDKALELHDKVIMFNRVSVLETLPRGLKFKHGRWSCLSKVYFHTFRVGCGKGEDGKADTAVFYAWYVFDKSFKGSPTMHWLTEGLTMSEWDKQYGGNS